MWQHATVERLSHFASKFEVTNAVQGVRPAGLQKVPTLELAEFINVCIGPRDGRPRARQLLKHQYFDTIRQEKCAQYKMQAENGLMTTGSGIPFSGQ